MSDEQGKPPPLRWHYGPTATDSESGKMWHYDCGGEVWWLKSDDQGNGGHICCLCNAQDEE